MKLLAASLILVVAACHSTSQPRPLKVAVLDTEAGHAHSRAVIEVIRTSYSAPCRLDIALFPIYEGGNLTVRRFRSALRETRSFSPEIVNISWNTLYREPYDPIVAALREVGGAAFLVAAAGEAPGWEHDHAAPSATVMGEVEHALVVGALSEGGDLAPGTFEDNPITALRPPEGTLGSSFSAALFTAKVAETLCRKRDFNSRQVLENKRRSGQRFPPLEELLDTRQ